MTTSKVNRSPGRNLKHWRGFLADLPPRRASNGDLQIAMKLKRSLHHRALMQLSRYSRERRAIRNGVISATQTVSARSRKQKQQYRVMVVTGDIIELIDKSALAEPCVFLSKPLAAISLRAALMQFAQPQKAS